MKKPTMKKEVAIDIIVRSVGVINFYATPDAKAEFEQFGSIQQFSNPPTLYQLVVDKRYDFDEVVAYIEGYGER